MTRHDRRRTPARVDTGHPPRDDARLRVAALAARLIAEGQTDYLAAKQKAARQLGVSDKKALPDNHEIEFALREHLALFQRDSQPRALQALRDSALRIMQRLAPFSPWLSGAVLTGTANEFSEIELELVGVDAKSFELHLRNAGVDFELQEHRHRAQTAGQVEFHCEFEALPLVITLYDNHAQRQAAHPRDSVKHERVQLEEARQRFSARELF